MINQLLENRDKVNHGEQSLTKLNMQNRQLESIDLSAADLHSFRQEMRKYGVDFSITKEKGTDIHAVYFKAQDIDRVYAGLKNCVESVMNKTRTPISEVMQEAIKKAEIQAAATDTPKKEKTPDREQSL